MTTMKTTAIICGVILTVLVYVKCENVILVHPTDKTVKMNSTIILTCQVKPNEVNKVQWIKNGFGIGTTANDLKDFSRSLGDVNKLTYPNPTEKGYYDLKIIHVNLKDEGTYNCQPTVKGHNLISSKAKVRVIVHSEPPQLLQLNDPLNPTNPNTPREPATNIVASIDNGHQLILKCSAKSGRPGAKLIWSVDNEPLLDEDNSRARSRVQKTKEIIRFGNRQNGVISGIINNTIVVHQSNRKLRDSYSIIKAKVNQIFNGKSIRCTAKNLGYENFYLPPAEAKVEILIPPMVSIDVLPKRNTIEYKENSIITFSCIAKGRPDKFTWSWFVNENEVPNNNEDIYKVKITRSFHKAIIKCVAKNHREGSANVKINVKYGPQFRTSKTSSVYPANIGDDVKMSCHVDSNPSSRIFWSRESSNDILGHNAVLYRKNVQDSDYGIYVCTAEAEGFTPIFRKVYLARKSKPIISSSIDKVISANENNAVLECVINSIPLPRSDEIKWFFQGHWLRESTKYSIYDKRILGVTTTYLQINNVDSIDMGNYNCSVFTKLGQDSKILKLSKKNSLPMILTVGVLIFLAIVIVIIIIIVCLWKNGIWSKRYQKGNPVQNRPGLNYNHISAGAQHHNLQHQLPPGAILHSNTSTVTTHDTMNSSAIQPSNTNNVEGDYQCQPNLFQWFPLSNREQQQQQQQQQHKSSFVRYGGGQDVDDKSSVRNGSVTQFRGVDICSNYTGSIPGSNNGDKTLRTNEIEDIYNAEMYPMSNQQSTNPAMVCSMHLTNGYPINFNRTSSPCQPTYNPHHHQHNPHMSPIPTQSPAALPQYHQYNQPPPTSNFILPSYPVHSSALLQPDFSQPTSITDPILELPPSLPPLDLGDHVPSTLNLPTYNHDPNIMSTSHHFLSNYLAPTQNNINNNNTSNNNSNNNNNNNISNNINKTKMTHFDNNNITTNNNYKTRTLDRRTDHLTSFTGIDQTTNI